VENQTLHDSEFDRFSRDVVRFTQETYGSHAAAVLEAIPKPVRTYYVRCNTIKISTDGLLKRLRNRGLTVSQHPVVPEAFGILVEGPFEVTNTNRRVLVDKLTSESVLQGANVYAPGIIDSGLLHPGDRVTVLSERNDILGTGEAVMSTNDILTFRKGLAVKLLERRYRSPQIRDLPEFSEGLLYPQSLAAMITSRILDPKEDECIVDLNCSPGGKLSHISQLLGNRGQVIGIDRNAEKVERARQTLIRLGCSNVTLAIHDSRYVSEDLPDLKADRVLVDPPCSALGLRPKIFDSTQHAKVSALADYQKQFLKSAAKIVKRGGVVVYSVCTFTLQECEEVVEFVERECGLRVVEQTPFIGSRDLRKAPTSTRSCQRFDPVNDEIGYFIAKFER
jgi:16S rRNA (cytosine967-C5)-methyltransferase